MIPPVAIQVSDLLSLKQTGALPFGMLMAPFISTSSALATVNGDAFDGFAVVVDGPAAGDDERVAGLVELLMTVLGPQKLGRRCRCYQQGSQGGWRELRRPEDLRRPEEMLQ
jgi:hypothetical protein